MKKILLILFICPIISFSQSLNKTIYKEFNVGIFSPVDGGFIFPGASFLIGQKNYYENNTLLDYQIGLAFPSIATAKIGYGLGNEKYATIFGVRAFPTSIYIQFSFKEKNNIALEILPFSQNMAGLDNETQGLIICYGYRF